MGFFRKKELKKEREMDAVTNDTKEFLSELGLTEEEINSQSIYDPDLDPQIKKYEDGIKERDWTDKFK